MSGSAVTFSHVKFLSIINRRRMVLLYCIDICVYIQERKSLKSSLLIFLLYCIYFVNFCDIIPKNRLIHGNWRPEMQYKVMNITRINAKLNVTAK